MPKVVIVGGGISGLALAYRLQSLHPALEVTVLEKGDRAGGKIWTEQAEGFRVEWGPNGFLDNKPAVLSLCQELGLADQLVSASDASSRNRFIFLGGKLQVLPGNPQSFLLSKVLSWRGKFNLLAERWRPRRRATSDETIAAFFRRRLGPEIARDLADAFVTGIYAGDPSLLSVRATFPRLVALEETHGSLLKGLAITARQRRAEAGGSSLSRRNTMWSFAEGLRLLVETLRERLRQAPVLGVAVRRLQPSASSWILHGEGRDRWEADTVVLTCPAGEQATILGDLDPELAAKVSGIAYNRVAVVALGYRQADIRGPLDGFGYLVPQRTRRDLLGVQWCSSIFPDRAPPGCVLLRALCGGWNRPEMVNWDDGRLVEAVRHELNLGMKIVAAPIFQRIIRWDRAIPQYFQGHLDRVAWIEARLARHHGLFLGGTAYRGVSLNDCVERADVLAGQVVSYLGTKSTG
jgi:oxygen-dependent protoporphyrinogen oxidase